MNADGSRRLRLTDNEADDHSSRWSPDGSKIAYVSKRDGNSEIYMINSDGSDPVNLTNDMARDTGPAWGPNRDFIAFSSDRNGFRDLYLMRPDAQGCSLCPLPPLMTECLHGTQPAPGSLFNTDRNGNEEVYRMAADGSLQTNLTNPGAADSAPDWE